MKNITFASLRENFDEVCETVNGSSEAVTLTLSGNRKVYILPEENYDCIQRVIIPSKNLVGR